jgi:hypothetical protein
MVHCYLNCIIRIIVPPYIYLPDCICFRPEYALPNDRHAYFLLAESYEAELLRRKLEKYISTEKLDPGNDLSSWWQLEISTGQSCKLMALHRYDTKS